MIKHLVLSGLVTVFSHLTAFAQVDGSDSDRKAILKLCRNLLKNAVTQMDSGNYDAALANLDSVFQCDPGNPDAFYYKALILGWRSDSASVMETLSEGTEKAPLSTRLKLMLARYLISRGSLDEAAVQIDMVLAIKPKEGEALFLKGLILEKQDDTNGALEMYRNAFNAASRK